MTTLMLAIIYVETCLQYLSFLSWKFLCDTVFETTILRKTIEGYLDSFSSLTFNATKT